MQEGERDGEEEEVGPEPRTPTATEENLREEPWSTGHGSAAPRSLADSEEEWTAQGGKGRAKKGNRGRVRSLDFVPQGNGCVCLLRTLGEVCVFVLGRGGGGAAAAARIHVVFAE